MIRTEGRSVLLAEQNATIALGYADFGYVVETGRIVKGSPSGALTGHDDLQASYLGGRKDPGRTAGRDRRRRAEFAL